MSCMLALNIYGTTSTFLVSVVLALAAQRLGTNAFLGSSQMSLKSHLLALIPFLVNITGCILDQSMLFSQQNSWFSNISLFGTLCLINGLGLIDMTGSLFVSFSWISDLKLKINVVLAESTASWTALKKYLTIIWNLSMQWNLSVLSCLLVSSSCALSLFI